MRFARLQPLRGLQSRPLQRLSKAAWICPSCHPNNHPSRRWNSSAQAKEKPFYVTTPIFYVNSGMLVQEYTLIHTWSIVTGKFNLTSVEAPHIGHLYTTVLADVAKRWQQINGREAYMCTGTDEHGMKIQRAATKEGMDPKAFCDLNSDKFRSLTYDADISNDFFIRTTDPDHKDAVAQFWLQLKHNLPGKLGLYKAKHRTPDGQEDHD
ncbi:hypothetical protein NQ176_g10220 [Zarea fungicola]|uniref:Uncharacterized protein n=1 Tax=Zarea fungicola TaxID=93591 RepID=A0ACC1MHZ8_9HYPO|nr:hypothetical protein NQ176_g10220 [Lecanicillium fungicola]